MHDKIQDLLQQYIDGELEILEALIVEEHLTSCHSCRKILNQFKLMDWDLKHQPVVDPPPELINYRKAAIKTYLATVKNADKKEPVKETWKMQKHIVQHTFSFISYNPVNRTVARSVKKTVSTLARAAGSGLRKRSPIISRFSPGQA